jgi:UDP-glucose 4-epimerase
MKRLAITGSSGYVGRTFVEHLRQRRGKVEILGLDIRPPGPAEAAPHRFVEVDIPGSALAKALRDFQPDTVVHAAFVLAPMRNRQKMRRINVEGCSDLLAAAASCGAERVMLVSSATAYGAWPDNPVPIEETWQLRPAKFQYAADKVAIESLAEAFAERHPAIAVSRVRPAIIGGAGMDNYLYRFIFGLPTLVLIDGYDTPLQFVHEEDVAAAMLAILSANARGAFNIGPPDWSPISEIAAATGRRTVRLPFWLVRMMQGFGWAARLPAYESPAEFLYFARYPWAIAPSRLQQELGYEFRYTSRETLREIIRSRQSPAKGA